MKSDQTESPIIHSLPNVEKIGPDWQTMYYGLAMTILRAKSELEMQSMCGAANNTHGRRCARILQDASIRILKTQKCAEIPAVFIQHES